MERILCGWLEEAIYIKTNNHICIYPNENKIFKIFILGISKKNILNKIKNSNQQFNYLHMNSKFENNYIIKQKFTLQK